MSKKLLKILKWPNPALTSVAEEITVFDSELKELADNMIRTMVKAQGIGLAANQVGVLQRIMIVKNPGDGKIYAMCNPRITEAGGTIMPQEGCLSFPGEQHFIQRSATVTVEYQGVDGVDCRLKATGWLAVCIQHEKDHLDAIVFTTKAVK